MPQNDPAFSHFPAFFGSSARPAGRCEGQRSLCFILHFFHPRYLLIAPSFRSQVTPDNGAFLRRSAPPVGSLGRAAPQSLAQWLTGGGGGQYGQGIPAISQGPYHMVRSGLSFSAIHSFIASCRSSSKVCPVVLRQYWSIFSRRTSVIPSGRR